MIRKYRIDFKWASGILIAPYSTEGIIIEAYTAEDALTQARIEVDEITRQNNVIISDGPWSGRWMITKIVPVPEPTEEKGD